MKFNKKVVLLLGILLVSFFLRIWSIGSESYWLDESISIRQAQENYSTLMEMVKNDIHMPLYITLLHFWVEVFGTSEFSSRFLSLIFGVFSVWIGYLLAKKLFSERIALIASALMAVSPILIYYSQEARLYSLFTLLTLLSFYFFLGYIEQKNAKNLALYGIFTLLLVYTHLFSFLVLFVQNAFMLYESRLKFKKIVMWLACQFILLLLFVPWLPNIIAQMGRKLNTMWIPKPNIGLFLGTQIEFFGNILIFSVFIVLVLLIALKKIKTMNSRAVFLLLWVAAPFAIVFSYSLLASSSVYHTRYMLFTLPAILMIFSWLLSRVIDKDKIVGYVLIGIIIVSSFASLTSQTINMDKDNWRQVSSFMKDNVQKQDFIFVDPFYHQDPFAYYYDNECFKEFDVFSCTYKSNVLSLNWMADCCNDTTKLAAQNEKDELKDYISRTIWLVSVRPNLYTENNSLFNYFSNTKNLTKTEEIGEIKIYRFESA